MDRYANEDDGGVVFLSGEVDVSCKGGDERRPKFSKKFEPGSVPSLTSGEPFLLAHSLTLSSLTRSSSK